MEITHTIVALWIAAAMHHLTPDRDTRELARSLVETMIAEHGSLSGPSILHVAAVEIAVMFREGSLDPKAVGDHGQSFCTGQINLPGSTRTAEGWSGQDLLESVDRCVHVTDRMLTESMRACAKLPLSDRLAGYARGYCGSKDGQRISRDRMWLSAQLLEKVPLFADADGEPEVFDVEPE
jgi:hypothetical protein